MADKATDIEKKGTVQENELGYELDDPRGRQGDRIVSKLFPVTGGGGGQSPQLAIITRYRPGNRYKYVRLNGTVTQFNVVQHDITFATEADRDSNVVNVAASNTQPIAGVWEQGTGGPLVTDPALQVDAAGIFGYMTVRGKTIANVDTATVAGDFLAPLGGGTVGRIHPLAVGATFVQTEVQRVLSLAAGLGARAIVAEPPTQPAAFKANLSWIVLT